MSSGLVIDRAEVCEVPLEKQRRPRLHVAGAVVSLSAQPQRWPEMVACILSFAGAVTGVLLGFHPREWQASGSDFKTLYAAADCFRRHVDPYSIANVAQVFQANHVVPPTSWYAHAPVYPPFTLAMIAPFTALPMVPAVYAWMAISTLSLMVAAYMLVRLADRAFGLSRPWRFALIALFAASPLLSFGLEMCNVSPMVGALCLVAVSLETRHRLTLTLAAASLAMALLLKPHMAIWVVAALVISRARRDRMLGMSAVAGFALACVPVATWMGAQHQLGAEMLSYRAMVHAEVAGGSMAATNHELVAVAAQITSLASLLGYWMRSASATLLSAAGIALLFGLLVALSLLRPRRSDSGRLVQLAAWSTFGLLATYHRAHDGMVLAVLLPYLLARVRDHWRNAFAAAVLVLYTVLAIGPTWETYGWLAAMPGLSGVANFMLYRQAPFAVLLLLLVLAGELGRVRFAHTLTVLTRRQSRVLAATAA